MRTVEVVVFIVAPLLVYGLTSWTRLGGEFKRHRG
jgi:cytochrome c oxidase assembly factor CtaG